MSGETISCHFVLILDNFLNDDISTIMNSYCIDSVFNLESKPLYQAVLSSKQDDVATVATVSIWFAFALAMMFSWQLSSVKAGRQQCEWDDKDLLGFFMF